MDWMEITWRLLLSFIFWGFVLGGFLGWWLLSVIIARVSFSNDGNAAAQQGIWGAFAILMISLPLSTYLWLGDKWIELTIFSIGALILPLILSFKFTLQD